MVHRSAADRCDVPLTLILQPILADQAIGPRGAELHGTGIFLRSGDVHHRSGMDEDRIGTALCAVDDFQSRDQAPIASLRVRRRDWSDFDNISDVPCAAIFMAIALGIFQKLGIKPGSNFGKAVMLGIPIGSLIGGVGTPAGSSINLLGLSTMHRMAFPGDFSFMDGDRDADGRHHAAHRVPGADEVVPARI